MFSFFRNNINKRKTSLVHLSYLYASNALSSLLGLILFVFLANTFTPTEYGNYKYIYSVVGILGVLSLSGGFRATIIQSAAKGYDGVLIELSRKNIPLNTPIILGGLLVGAYYIFQENYLIGFTVPILVINTVISNNGLLASAYLNGRSLHKELMAFQLISGLVNIFSIVIITLFTTHITLVIATSSLVLALVSTLALVYVRSKYLRSQETSNRISSYGKHLNIISIATTIMQHIDSIIIFSLIGSTSLASYAVATPLIDRLLGFLKSSYYYLLPKFTEYGPNDARRGLYKKTIFSFILGLFVYVIYYISAPFLFDYLLPQYREAIGISLLFALNIPLAALALVPLAYIDSLIEIKNKYILNGTVFVSRIITLPLGAIFMGVYGVIYSELFTRFVSVVILYILIKKKPIEHGLNQTVGV